MFPPLALPDAPLFPAFSKKDNTFVHSDPRQFRYQLRRLLRGLSKGSNAQLAYFRHCATTSIGKGNREKTEQVSALLNHSAQTALQVRFKTI